MRYRTAAISCFVLIGGMRMVPARYQLTTDSFLTLPFSAWAFRGINNSKATGMAAIARGLLESFFSPLFWILAISFFALFFAASRLSSKPMRILLSWTPVTILLQRNASAYHLDIPETVRRPLAPA